MVTNLSQLIETSYGVIPLRFMEPYRLKLLCCNCEGTKETRWCSASEFARYYGNSLKLRDNCDQRLVHLSGTLIVLKTNGLCDRCLDDLYPYPARLCSENKA